MHKHEKYCYYCLILFIIKIVNTCAFVSVQYYKIPISLYNFRKCVLNFINSPKQTTSLRRKMLVENPLQFNIHIDL